MARFETIPPDKMTAEQKAVVDEINAGPRGPLGASRGPFPVMIHSPGLCSASQKLGAYARFTSVLPEHLKELAVSIVGRFWGAHVEWNAHSRLAVEAGIDQAVIDALRDGNRPSFKNDDEEVIYDFLTALLDKRSVDDATYKRCLETLGERGLIDLMATVTHYTIVSMTLNTFHVPVPGVDIPFGPGRDVAGRR